MSLNYEQFQAYIDGLYADGSLSEQDYNDIILYILANGEIEKTPRDLIQVRRGNYENLPNLAQGELAYTMDTEELFVGGLNGNVNINKEMYVNVKKFGAKGDGINDDSRAIQETIEYCKVNGGSVFIPRTNFFYFIGETIELKSNVNIISDGATLKTEESNFSVLHDKSSVKNIIIEGLKIEGKQKEGRGGGDNILPIPTENNHDFGCIYLGDNNLISENITIKNCSFKNRRMGVVVANVESFNIENCLFESLADPIGVGFQNVDVDVATKNGFISKNILKDYGYLQNDLTHGIYISTESLNTTKNIVVNDNIFLNGVGGFAISMNWGYENIQIYNNMVLDNFGGGINTSQETGRNEVILSENVRMYNNFFKGVRIGFRLQGGEVGRVKNIIVENNKMVDVKETAITVYNVTDSKILGNVIEKAIQGNKNSITKFQYSERIDIIDNNIFDSVGIGDTTLSAGIYSVGCKDFIIKNNKIYDVPANGIYFNGMSTEGNQGILVIENNIFNNYGVTVTNRSGIGLAGSVVGAVIKNNVMMNSNGGYALSSTVNCTNNFMGFNTSIKGGGNFNNASPTENTIKENNVVA